MLKAIAIIIFILEMEIYEDYIDNKYWTSKYRPRKISDIVGNQTQIENICTWLDTYEKNAKELRYIGKKKGLKIKEDDINDTEGVELIEKIMNKKKPNNPKQSCLIITGNHGVGKTCLITTILMEKGYTIKMIDFSKIGSIKEKQPQSLKNNKKRGNTSEIINILEKTLFGKDIYDLIQGNENKKCAILIDDIESVISINEKKLVIATLKYNNCYWKNPIIFISDNNHNKVINTIKSFSYEIKVQPPLNTDLFKLLCTICNKESMKIENRSLAYKIIDESQSDFRKLISFLENIKSLYPNKIFIEEYFAKLSNSYKHKDIDIGIFDAANSLIYFYKNLEQAQQLYETEKVLIPLMIQQNYIQKIDKHGFSKNKTDILKKISKSLSDADIIENYIYGDQNWDLKNIHGFLSCIYPSYELTSLLNPNLSQINKDSIYGLTFPIDLNRTSIKKINKKQIIKLKKKFKNMEIYDYIKMNKIIKTLFELDEINKCNELFQDYDCTIGNIESILKIDKVDEKKYTISANIKKKLSIKEDVKDNDSDSDYSVE